MDDIFNTPQNNDSENRNEAPPKANESNAPYNSPISSSAYESYQPKPQQNNSYNGTPYGAPQGAYSQRPEPPRYNQENNQYGNGPQFNPSYSQMKCRAFGFAPKIAVLGCLHDTLKPR